MVMKSKRLITYCFYAVWVLRFPLSYDFIHFFLLWCDFLNLFYRLNLKYTRHIKRSDIEATIVCRKAIRWLQETWMRLRPWWRKWLWNFKKRILKYGNGWFPICFMLLSCMWLCYPSLIVLFLKKSCVFFSDLVFPIITQIMRSQGSCVLIQGVFFSTKIHIV